VRSVFVLIRHATEAEVTAYLDRVYPSDPRPPWVLWGGNGPCLYINFYRDLSRECGPEEYANLTHRFGGEPTVAVMADVSGRYPGDEQALEFATGLLRRFSGAAMDDYTEYLWSLAELQAGHHILGHKFFDCNGWYAERGVDV
jgi:hypothetical protein